MAPGHRECCGNQSQRRLGFCFSPAVDKDLEPALSCNYICCDIILLTMGKTSFLVTSVRICFVILAFLVYQSPCMFYPLSESKVGKHRGSLRCSCEAGGLSSPGQVSRRELVTSSGTRRLHSGRYNVGLMARPRPTPGCPFVALPFCPSHSGAQHPEARP